MVLSVCITAYDQHPLTIAHIKGCLASSLIPDEIIVVNDECKLSSAKKKPQEQYYSTKKGHIKL